MLADNHIKAADLIGNRDKIKQIKPTQYTNEQFGLPTISDILAELEKPGRDPRGEFQTATFTEGVNEIKDLQLGMILEGVVSNVANFGAFVEHRRTPRRPGAHLRAGQSISYKTRAKW